MMDTGMSILLVALLPLGVLGQGALIDDGNIAVGVREEGFIELPDLFGEGWGAGIRGEDGVTIHDECGAHDNGLFSSNRLTNVEVERFRGEDGDSNAESKVLCGREKLLRVRHQFRTAERRPGCEGAYEIKVTVENRACTGIGEVLYRRNSDPDVAGSTTNLFTIQGTDEVFFSEFATNSLRCNVLPSTPCTRDPPPFTDLGPKDQGNVFQISLGELGAGKKVVFYMYYGVFENQAAAEECLDGALIDLYSLAKDDNAAKTFMFGFRRSLTELSSSLGEECIDLVPPVEISIERRLRADADVQEPVVEELSDEEVAAIKEHVKKMKEGLTFEEFFEAERVEASGK